MPAVIAPVIKGVFNLRSHLLFAVFILTPPSYASGGPVKSLLEMRQENVVIQNWDLSCGAAALATILNYQYHDKVTEREVAIGLMQRKQYVDNPQLIRTREGFSLLDLQRYVERRGYKGAAFGQLTTEDIIDMAPVIVPVNFYGYNHFVVFRGAYGDQVLLADPAWGNRTMSMDRFVRIWINYPDMGRIGFVVSHDGQPATANALAVKPNDFPFSPRIN